MTWQRALVRCPDLDGLAGELWVRVERPVIRRGWPSYETHLRMDDLSRCYVRADRSELLARGPEDFTSSAPLVELTSEWIERQRSMEGRSHGIH